MILQLLLVILKLNASSNQEWILAVDWEILPIQDAVADSLDHLVVIINADQHWKMKVVIINALDHLVVIINADQHWKMKVVDAGLFVKMTIEPLPFLVEALILN